MLFSGFRLKEHVRSPDTMPVLIFPEGTCINNTSVMMFKKGSFEAGATVYPVAMKYDPRLVHECHLLILFHLIPHLAIYYRFCDPFWNSSKESWGQYILMLMTSWALVVQVWYLPPMSQEVRLLIFLWFTILSVN